MGSLFGSANNPAAGQDASSAVVRSKFNWIYEVLSTLLVYATDDSAGCTLRENIGRRPGQIIINAHAQDEPGCLPCDGGAYSRASYAALYAKIGVIWGSGDGVTTFNVPLFNGRTLVMSGVNAEGVTRTVGQTFGADAKLITIAKMPQHNHPGSTTTGVGEQGDTWNCLSAGGNDVTTHRPLNIANQGGGEPFDVTQESAVVKAWIKY